MLYTEWEINNIHHQTAFVNNNQIPHLPLDTFDAILDWKANYLQSKYACARGHSGVHCRSEANARDHSRVLALLNAPQLSAALCSQIFIGWFLRMRIKSFRFINSFAKYKILRLTEPSMLFTLAIFTKHSYGNMFFLYS